jgi:hypothetical protein
LPEPICARLASNGLHSTLEDIEMAKGLNAKKEKKKPKQQTAAKPQKKS